MSRTSSEFGLKKLPLLLIWQIVIWGPVVVGLVHQFLMYFFEIDSIYVFVDPPGSIRPFVSLGWQWWFVLLLASSTLCIAAYSNRFRSIPNRVAIPTYLYVLFLLILVKPV